MSKPPLTIKQRLHWDHRRLNNVNSQLLGLREWFDGDELATAMNQVNTALKRVETLQKTINAAKIAKPWSKRR